MRYELDLALALCSKMGVSARVVAGQRVEIDVGEGAVLCFENAEHDDCSIGFLDTPWHAHGHLMFADGGGNWVELDYLGLIVGLKEGEVLVCEQQMDSRTTDRWLVHKEYNDEFKHLQEGECIVVRRAAMPPLNEPS